MHEELNGKRGPTGRGHSITCVPRPWRPGLRKNRPFGPRANGRYLRPTSGWGWPKHVASCDVVTRSLCNLHHGPSTWPRIVKARPLLVSLHLIGMAGDLAGI